MELVELDLFKRIIDNCLTALIIIKAVEQWITSYLVDYKIIRFEAIKIKSINYPKVN